MSEEAYRMKSLLSGMQLGGMPSLATEREHKQFYSPVMRRVVTELVNEGLMEEDPNNRFKIRTTAEGASKIMELTLYHIKTLAKEPVARAQSAKCEDS